MPASLKTPRNKKRMDKSRINDCIFKLRGNYGIVKNKSQTELIGFICSTARIRVSKIKESTVIVTEAYL